MPNKHTAAAPDSKTVADAVILLATKWLGHSMEGSARLCLDDANALRAKGDYLAAGRRALDSLRYSVGIFAPVYQRAARYIDEVVEASR